ADFEEALGLPQGVSRWLLRAIPQEVLHFLFVLNRPRAVENNQKVNNSFFLKPCSVAFIRTIPTASLAGLTFVLMDRVGCGIGAVVELPRRSIVVSEFVRCSDHCVKQGSAVPPPPRCWATSAREI